MLWAATMMLTGTPAIVLLSGGLDSATTLAIARDEGFVCHALSFDYGQKHRVELDAATRVAQNLSVASHRIINVDGSAFKDSALICPEKAVPKERDPNDTSIPSTYVPARNTIFLAYALALAETLRARDIFIGVSAVDYSGYPDCRPEYIDAFQRMASLATRSGVEGDPVKVHAPLIELSKGETIRRGIALGVDYSETLSCYDPVRALACGRCDSCRLRREGFEAAGVRDPTRYF